MSQGSGDWWDRASPWLAAAVAAITANLAAASLGELLGMPRWPRWLASVVWVALFSSAVVWVYREREKFGKPRTRYLKPDDPPEQREHLILFLSHIVQHPGRGVPDWVTLTGNLQKDLEDIVVAKQGKPNWPWEMSLRSIAHHLGRLRSVTVVCSDASLLQAHWFADLLGRYEAIRSLSMRVLVKHRGSPQLRDLAGEGSVADCDGWNFEAFDDLSAAMAFLLPALRKEGVRDEQVMVDFTGGQKPTSVLAAAMTFDRAIKAQYVQTNPPYRVIGYDFVYGSRDAEGLGF